MSEKFKDEDRGVFLTVAGCGDAFGSGGRLTTCFHVKTGSHQFLIDCGITALAGLKRCGIRQEDIDTVLITHFHGDHYGGLPFLLLEAAVYGRQKPLTIVSPPGCREKLVQLLTLLYPSSQVLEKLNLVFREYQPMEKIVLEHLSVQAFPVIHTEAALPHGLRVETAGKVIAYSGDTEWTPVLTDISEAADIFICECNFYKMDIKGHLNYFVLKEHLEMLACKRIVLTHLDTEMLNNLSKVELECAQDGQVFQI